VWLKETRPDVFGAAASWVSFAEYLYATLFGKRAVSISIASGTGILDQAGCSWDLDLLSVLSVRQEQLSPLADISDVMAGLLPVLAALAGPVVRALVSSAG
jgi:gluconokinase